MEFSFFSIVTERPRLSDATNNLVAFADTPELLTVHPDLIAAADIVQARFRNAAFLMEAGGAVSASTLVTMQDTFEVALDSNLFCVPFSQRRRLPDPDYVLTTFGVYLRVFDLFKGKGDVNDINTLWGELYAESGLICFRLVLPTLNAP